MTPGERIDAIKTIKQALAGMTPADAHLHVNEFASSWPMTWDHWLDENNRDDRDDWLTRIIGTLESGELAALLGYLTTARPTVDESRLPWRRQEFRLFLSHISQERVFMGHLASALHRFGIHGFVAHEHIEPGSDWVEVIKSSLLTCDALVAVLHDGFHDSKWTDQEVGHVLGQNKFAVAVRAGIDPYGFIGAVQGIPAPPQMFDPNANQLTVAMVLGRDIAQVLAAEPRTRTALRDALVNRLVTSSSWNMSNEIVDILRQCPTVTEDQYKRLREAQDVNEEVGRAFNVGPFLDGLISVYPPEPPAPPDSHAVWDDDPF